MEKRNISDLPPEILIKIFEQLESPEIFKISEVCKDWLNIAQHPTIVNKTIVKLHSLENNRFLKSWRKFNFKLNIDTHLPEKYFEFKEKFLENIIEIEFDQIYLPSLDVLRQYLENLTNLKSLSFNDCRFQNLTISPDVLISLNVTSLLFKGGFLKHSVVDYIISVTPNLKALTAYLYKTDYISTIVSYVNDPELTKSLRELNIYDGLSSDFSDLFQSKHLNLLKFVWNSPCCRRFSENQQSFDIFLTNQTNLKSLNLNVHTRDTELLLPKVIRICSLNTLEHLTFDCAQDNDIQYLNYEPFWKLKSLELVSSNEIIFHSLTKSSKMESLKLTQFCGDFDIMIKTNKFELLTNLMVFKLCLGQIYTLSKTMMIQNRIIQAISKHLINLRELWLEDNIVVCQNGSVTDSGITGSTGEGFPMSRLLKLEKFTLFTDIRKLTDVSVRHIESMKSIRPNQIKMYRPRGVEISNNPFFNFL